MELTALLVSCEACNATVAGASKVIHFTQFAHGRGDDDDVAVVAVGGEDFGGLWRILDGVFRCKGRVAFAKDRLPSRIEERFSFFSEI